MVLRKYAKKRASGLLPKVNNSELACQRPSPLEGVWGCIEKVKTSLKRLYNSLKNSKYHIKKENALKY